MHILLGQSGISSEHETEADPAEINTKTKSRNLGIIYIIEYLSTQEPLQNGFQEGHNHVLKLETGVPIA
jgi:hypothetical protein